MATRTLSPEVIELITAKVVEPVLFVFADFPSGARRVWTGKGFYTDAEDNVWEGVGSVIGFDTFSETVDTGARGIRATLNGMDPALIAQLVGDNYQGREVRIDLAFWDRASGEIIFPPEPIWRGTLDTDEVEDSGESSSLALNAEHRLVDILRKREFRYTDRDQQFLYIVNDEPLTVPSMGAEEAETTVWKDGITAAGGSLGTDSLAIANNLVTVMKSRTYFSKLVYFLPLLGADLLAAMQPLIDSQDAGRPTNLGFVDADFSEAAGLAGSEGCRWTLPLRASNLGTNNGGMGYWELDIRQLGPSATPLGAYSDSGTYFYGVLLVSGVRRFDWGAASTGAGDGGAPTAQHYYGQATSTVQRRLFRNGDQVAENNAPDGLAGIGERFIEFMGYSTESLSGGYLGRAGCAYLTNGALTLAEIEQLHDDIRENLMYMTGRKTAITEPDTGLDKMEQIQDLSIPWGRTQS